MFNKILTGLPSLFIVLGLFVFSNCGSEQDVATLDGSVNQSQQADTLHRLGPDNSESHNARFTSKVMTRRVIREGKFTQEYDVKLGFFSGTTLSGKLDDYDEVYITLTRYNVAVGAEKTDSSGVIIDGPTLWETDKTLLFETKKYKDIDVEPAMYQYEITIDAYTNGQGWDENIYDGFKQIVVVNDNSDNIPSVD